MIPRQHPPKHLLSLAHLQSGMLTAEQVRGHGVGRSTVDRLTGEGQWRRIATGLYLTRDGEPDWMARVWGGTLLGGDGARIGGLAAAHLWRVHDAAPDDIVVLVPHDRRVQTREGWRFVRERHGVRAPRSFGDPPRLGLADTILDLCDEADDGAVVDLVLCAVQRRRVSVAALRRGVGQRGRVRHRRLLIDLLADADEGAETPLELRYLRDVERAHALPEGRRQRSARKARHVRDVVYDDFGLVVELDGRLGHEGMGRFRDMNRDNLAVLSGEQTLRYGWPDVTGVPCEVARQVGLALAQRGWRGVVERCPRCRHLPDDDQWGS